MIRSMTAFARVSRSVKGTTWAVEIRSLNHRYFEFSLRLPPTLSDYETKIRDLVQSHIKRGKVVVAISQDMDEEKLKKEVTLNEPALKVYLEASRKMKRKFKLEGDVTVSDVLRLPGIFSLKTVEQDPKKVWPTLEKFLKEALAKAIKAKELEGRKLSVDIKSRLGTIGAAVKKIEQFANGRSKEIFKKLSERVDALLEDKEKDPDRLHREVVFLTDRSDITEELVRIRSHLDLFASRLKSTGEVGRELDFLCQEMNREINTMGSKSQLFDISKHVIQVKGEIEKIREQIQNIE